jgi:amidase
MLARDAFDIPVGGIGEALLPIARALGAGQEVTLFAHGVDEWLDTFRPLQLHELWSTHGAWGTAPSRTLSEAVAQRIELAATVKPADVAAATVRREALARRVVALLDHDGLIVIPTAHDLPPARDAPVSAQVAFREKTLALTCVASLTRLPQINVPVTKVDGCPVGLSLIGGPGSDEVLLAVAEELGAVTSKALADA